MATKGQTCESCAGTCCTIGIAYSFGDNKPKWFKNSRNIRHSTLISLGAKEILLRDLLGYEEDLIVCGSFEDGKCSRYKNRSSLCRSYYCHGRYWKSKHG